MIYFDNAATGGFKPYSVQEVAEAAIKHLCANPSRSGHRLSETGGEIVFRTRKLIREVFNGASADRVIFTKNATEALNTAILGLLKKGDHVVTTCMEHNSVLRPLHSLKAAGIVDLTVFYPQKSAYITQKQLIRYDDIRPLIKENTRLVITNHVSNVTGAEADVSGIGNGLKRDFPSVLYVVDGAQSGGHIPLDMVGDKIDALCLAGHKGLMGIMGSGVLILSEQASPTPLTYGGTGSDSFNLLQPDFYPDRLESGTLNLPAIAALFEGVLYIKNNLEFISERLYKMTEALIERLTAIKGINIYSLPNRSGIVAFSADGYAAEEYTATLSRKYDIATRGGFHCAPLMHKYLDTASDGLVRASLSPFNTFKEISSFANAVKHLANKN